MIEEAYSPFYSGIVVFGRFLLELTQGVSEYIIFICVSFVLPKNTPIVHKVRARNEDVVKIHSIYVYSIQCVWGPKLGNQHSEVIGSFHSSIFPRHQRPSFSCIIPDEDMLKWMQDFIEPCKSPIFSSNTANCHAVFRQCLFV